MTVVKSARLGTGLSYALGLAAARWQGREGKVVLCPKATVASVQIRKPRRQRQGLRIRIRAMNDGGVRPVVQSLRADGLDDSVALLLACARKHRRGFGPRGDEEVAAHVSCDPAAVR